MSLAVALVLAVAIALALDLAQESLDTLHLVDAAIPLLVVVANEQSLVPTRPPAAGAMQLANAARTDPYSNVSTAMDLELA